MLAYWSGVVERLSRDGEAQADTGPTIERSDYSLETGETPVQSYVIHGGGHDRFDLSGMERTGSAIWSFLSDVSGWGHGATPSPGLDVTAGHAQLDEGQPSPDGMYTGAGILHPSRDRDTWTAPMGGFAIDWSAIPQPFSIDGSSPLYGIKNGDAAGDGSSEALRFDGLGVFHAQRQQTTEPPISMAMIGCIRSGMAC